MKQPRKIQDPTEAALSAIQEALTLQLDNPDGAPAEDRTTQQGARDPRPRRSRVEVADRRAANDDRQTVGQLLSQLQRRSSPAPYWWAAGLAILWLGFGTPYVLAALRTAAPGASGFDALLASPALMAILGSLIIPPIAFFALAAMVRRSRDLQLIGKSMTEVALRLAQPESLGTDAVVTVGQAVRREVAAMGEGLDRAIARAAELETVVRSEVAILERAYEDNEIRIRSLINELQAERESVLTHTERLREGILDAETMLSGEVRQAADRVQDNVAAALLGLLGD
ncbi:MAG: hypothetical protein B7X76_08820, partial [Azorhizobium sp. 39-67-5]